MSEHKQYRQGDILFVLTECVPKGGVLLDHLIIAEGEATGHIHEAVGPACELYEESGTKYLLAKSESKIVHTEHKEIVLPAGTYKVIRQREFVPRRRRAGWRAVPD